MTLKIENGGQKQEKVIPWSPDVFGPYGAELSLSRKPIKPGEVRKIKIFIPDLNKVGEATLTARGIEPVALGGGTNRDLLRVDQEIAFEDGKKAARDEHHPLGRRRRPGPQELHRRQRRDGHLPDDQGGRARAGARSST